ncbi:MAG TPA: DNA polymerase Y family protein [Rhodanobacteraceae bacterium]|nr:DNA polymerase Y family protein [Rhodanobacteraceae bacterium]
MSVAWACISLPHLALDGVLRRRADAHAPLALMDGPPHARVLRDVNEAAARAGLRAGQPLTAARALLAHFEAVPFDAAAMEHSHRFLAAVAYRYSSEVALLPDAVVLEIGRSRSLFGPWPELAQRLRDDLMQLGFRHRLAAAPTPQAAHALAGYADGSAILESKDLRAGLSRLPTLRAGLPDETATTLMQMGLRTLGQVLDAPRDGLRRRFGNALLQALDRLTGAAPDGLARYRPPDCFAQRVEFEPEVGNLSALLFPLRRLVGDLAAYLSGRDGGVQRFIIELEHAHDGGSASDSTRVQVGLLEPLRDPEALFEFSRGRLEALRLRAPVRTMRVRADELPPFVPAGRDLFDRRPAHALTMTQLRERLRARLGDDAIYRLRETPDPRPERAQSREAEAVIRETLPRPTWLLERPIPLRGPAPELLAGPERLETGWWDGEPVRRDYYVAQTSQGQRAWIFCAAGQRGPWMLHGWFA